MTQLDSAGLSNDPVQSRTPPRYKFPSTQPAPEPSRTAQFAQFATDLYRGTVTPKQAEDVGTALYESAANGPLGRVIQATVRGYDAQFPVDPNFRLTEETLKPYTEGVSQDLWDQYSDAHSKDHLEAMYLRNVAEMDHREQLAAAGWSAAPAQILAEVADPLTLAAGALTGGVGAAGSLSTKAARLASLAKSGLIAGVPFAAVKGLQSIADPNVTNLDIAEAGLSGFGFGIGAALTHSSGPLVHGIASGAGAAVPSLAVGQFRDQDSTDAWIGFTSSFLMGAAGAGLSRYAQGKVLPIMDEQYKAARLSDVPEVSLLTKEGREAFSKQIDPQTEIDRLDSHAKLVFNETPEPPAPVAAPAPAVVAPPKKTTKGVFTKADIESRLLRMYDEQANQIGPEAYDIAGQGFGVEELAHEFGSEEAAAMMKRGTLDLSKLDKRSDQYKQVLELARSSAAASPDPQMQFLAALHENLPKGRTPAKEPFTPAEIDTGAEFTINGEKFKVESAPDGSHRILTDGGTIPEVPLEALDIVPVDKGSMTRDPEMAAMGDTNDYSIPQDEFGSIRRDLLGQPFVEPATGTQQGFAFGTEGSTSSQFARTGDATDAKIAAKFDENATGNLRDTIADTAAQMSLDQRGAVGAASAAEFKYRGNSIPGEGKNAGTDFEASFIGDDKPSMMAKVGPISTRWGINAALSNSDSQLASRFGNIVAFDNLPKKNGRIYGAGDMWAESGAKRQTADLFRGIEEDYRGYAKAGGELTRSQYSEEIGKAVRRGVDGYDGAAQVKSSAKRVQSMYAETLALQERHGVKGAGDVNANVTYFTRRWLPDRVDRAIQEHGNEKVLGLLSEAIAAKNDWATPKQVVAMAEAIIKNGGRPGKMANPLGFLEGSLDEIARDLAESNMDPAQVESIVTMLRSKYKPEGDGQNPRNLKYRIDMDETHSVQTKKGPLSVEDLLDNNAHRVTRSYIRSAYGNSAGAETLRVLSPDPQNPMTFDEIKMRVREEAQTKGLDRIRIEGDILKMETAWKNMVGLPMSDDVANSRLWKAAGILRSGLSSSMLGNWYAGLTNAAEPLAALAHPETLGRMFPALPELFAAAKNGKPSAATLRDFEFLTGRGLDQITGAIDTYIPVHGESIDVVLARGQQVAQKARNVSGAVSGFNVANNWGYRLLGHDILQKWGDWGKSGKLPPKTVLAEFGLKDEGLVRTVLAQIKEHGESIKGPQTGVQMWDLHLEKWTDIEAMSAFRAAVYAEAGTRFVNPLPNQLARWMSTDFGKLFAQFRTFNIASWDSKLLQGIKSKNLAHVRMFAVNGGLSAALYSLKVYSDSLTREDGQEYRDEMLSPSHIARVAFSRSSYMSMLPAAVDAAVAPVTGEALFSFSRGSGIRGTGLMSVPLMDWMGGTVDGVGGAIRHIYDPDYSFSMQDLRNVRRSIPFIPQVEPLVKGIDLLGRAVGLPEKSKD